MTTLDRNIAQLHVAARYARAFSVDLCEAVERVGHWFPIYLTRTDREGVTSLDSLPFMPQGARGSSTT